MEKKFQLMEHTADVGIIAFGSNLSQCFEHAAEGMFNIIADISTVVADERKDVTITSSDKESLLVDWLNELIYLFDIEYLLFSKFEIYEMDDRSLRARIYGEKVDISRHAITTGIKAATWHMLSIQEHDCCRIRVLFDI